MGELVNLERERRDRAERCRIHATSMRVDIALDLVEIACAAVRGVAALEAFTERVGQQLRIQEFLIECAA